jgi:hypothetical protein
MGALAMATDDSTKKEQLKDTGKTAKRVSFLDRAIQQAIGDERILGRQDDPAKAKFPELWKWLTQTECPGNRIKQPATLMIRMGPEGVLVSINDRDLGYAVDVCCTHLMEILEACERALTSDNPSIRTNPKKDPNLRKRRNQS